MISIIRHTGLLLLGLLILVGVACGDSQPLPDIDATVEARVELAKASLVASSPVPLPTYKPLPTYTPVATPVPEVVIKEVDVIKEVEVIKEVIVEKEVIKEVPVEKVVEVIKEVIVEKEVIKEVPVEKIVKLEKTVVEIVEVVVTATPTATPTQVPSTATPTPTPTATPIPTATATPIPTPTSTADIKLSDLSSDPTTIIELRFTDPVMTPSAVLEGQECFGVYSTNISDKTVTARSLQITGYTQKDVEVETVYFGRHSSLLPGHKYYSQVCFEERVTKKVIEYGEIYESAWAYTGGFPDLTPLPSPFSPDIDIFGPSMVKGGVLRLDLIGALGEYIELVPVSSGQFIIDETGAYLGDSLYNNGGHLFLKFDNISDIDLQVTHCAALYELPPVEPDTLRSWQCKSKILFAKKSTAVQLHDVDRYADRQWRLLGLWLTTREKSPW